MIEGSLIEGSYRLTPMQQGMLFHSLSTPDDGIYVAQVLCKMPSDLDLCAFERAWQSVINRHDVLRTYFLWHGLNEPLQKVCEDISVPIDIQDWTNVPATDQDGLLQSHLLHERRCGFDFSTAPLMRFALLKMADGENLFLWTFHHILLDGRSRVTVMKEVALFYEAYCSSQNLELPRPPIYADYIDWFYRQDQSDAEQYWRKLLGTFSTPVKVELPQESDERQSGDRYQTAHLNLSAGLKTSLRQLARSRKLTVNLILQAAWAVLLARYSSQDDVVFGETRAARLRDFEKAGSVIGLLINTVPIRLHAEGSKTFLEMLQELRDQHVEMRAHDCTPLTNIRESSGIDRTAELFQSIVVFEEYNLGSALQREGCELWRGGVSRFCPVHYPLTLAGYSKPELLLRIDYDRWSYSDKAMERLVGHLTALLESVTRDPQARIANLPLLTSAEQQQVVYDWNATEEDYSREKCVHELFEAQAERTPDAVAVVFEDAVLSYGELNRRANQLAHYLRGPAVGPDVRVAICAERGLELVVALLAVLKAGGAYVPLDSSYPSERKALLISDSGAKLILASKDMELPEKSAVRRVDIDQWVLDGAQAENPEVGQDSEALAYVMYTSGSTGQPKGVMVPHRAIARLVLNCGYADFTASDAVAFASNPAFDASTMEVWAPLLNGGRIVVIDQESLLEPAQLGQKLKQHQVNILWLTVGLFNQYADALREELASLRYLIVGGDALDPRVIARVLHGDSPQHLVNGYGPTETTTFAATHEISAVPEDARSIPIGRPIGNTQIYILDQFMEPVPIGVTGELFIGGAGVALGYLNRPELTAERFSMDPFTEKAGARMYRTGDLGRWLENGTIEFLGRNDFQVKIRGYRIELGEIEARLAEHAGVREAVVLARDTMGDKRLVAYYTCVEANGGGIGAEKLRAHLGNKLPEYMVPAAYVQLERLQLTLNGKVDRKSLPAPEGDAYVARGYEAPLDETERVLAGIWVEVLGVEQAGRYDNFFELGGHSLLAMQFISQLRQVLGVEVAIKDLFAYPVLTDFARVVERSTRTALPAITLAERGRPLPLSFAQQRLWFLAQMEGVSEAYHIFCGWRLKGDLDRRALRQALDQIVSRHEALRTRFVSVEGEPMQRIISAEESRFHLVEYELKEARNGEEELNRLATEEASASFDLEQGPLIRGRLIGVGEKEHALLITMHHIVSDGWSMDIFIKELTALYGAFARGEAEPLAELAMQYADYAVWQRQWLQGEMLRKQAEYWQQALAGAPLLLELPTDHTRPAVQEYAGGSVELELDEELTRKLKEMSQRAGTTLYMTLLAGWSVLLARLSGQGDIVIGTPVANRGRVEIEGLIGFFVNTLALRLDLSGSPTVRELLQRVKERVVAAQQHQDIPFEQVVEIVRPARSLAHNPLFQVMFDWWQWSREGSLALPDLEVEKLQSTRMVAKFDLRLCLQEAGARIVGRLEYATALFERETAQRYLRRWRRLIEGMVAGDMQAVDRLPLLGEAERLQVLVEWNATEVYFPREKGVHELFEAQVEKSPEAIAVVDRDKGLTYSGLNARANRLAHHLCALGVGSDARVAIILGRSMDLVVAELAILKCGAAYVPIDPTFPGERQVFMLADCAARVVITTRSAALPEALGPSRINIDDFDQIEAALENLSLLSDGEMTAYVMYTSGSTGNPKGVIVPHRAITRLVLNCGYADFEFGDRVAFAANPAFDAATMEVWAPLLNGGRIVVLDPDRVLEPLMFAEALIEYEVSVLWMTAGLFNQYVHILSDVFRRLRYLIVGGDVLDPRMIAEVLRHAPPRHLVNGYGPTETTTFAITYEITEASEATRSIPLGSPISNTQSYILDENHQPSPIGVGGEIYIGGAGVAHGYLNRPELTAESFLPDPFGREPGARLYKTGDLARWLPGGEIEFLGRNDFQVKIRGFRVELAEIEARLTSHPGVYEAVVLAYDDGDAGKRLAAYFTGQDIGAEALRSYLSAQLPEYMLPAAYVRLERLPLTPNGKVDRKSLPAPEGDAYAAREYEAPAGETETALANIWADILKLDRVGRYDNFFELGGHSLLATRVVNRIRTTLGIEFSLRILFETPTVSEIAERLKSPGTVRIPLRPIVPQYGIQPK